MRQARRHAVRRNDDRCAPSSAVRRAVARLLLPLLLCAPHVHAAEEPPYHWFTVTLENDIFVGKDSGYTNGLGVSWADAGFREFTPENLPGWLLALSRETYISTMPRKVRATSYSISQLMQTPSDITVAEQVDDEAPYVGLLLWFGNLHAFDERVADRLSLGLGVAGPLSGAEQGQKLVHGATDCDEPRGWDHQIGNEPVFQLSAERLLRLRSFHTDSRLDVDVIGIGNGAVGNLESYLALGVGARLGRNLDRTFPTASFLPGRQASPLAGSATGGWSLFVNVQGRYVANEIAVNGNTFAKSHSAALEHWQAAATTGVAYGVDRWAFLFSVLVGTDRYEGQPDATRFGSLSVTYNY